MQSRRIVSYVDVLSSYLNRKRKAAESVSGFGSIETEDVNPLASGNTKVAMIRPESADARNAILGSQNNNLGLKGPAVVSTVLKYRFYILFYSTKQLWLVPLYFPLVTYIMLRRSIFS